MKNTKRTDPTSDEITRWLHIAESSARQAGTLICEMLEKPINVRSKGFRDLVTDADYASQRLITEMIKDDFPEHGFLAEEEDAALETERSVRWVIDPIDGTSNYSLGIPTFCISIGVAIEDRIVLGIVYAPKLDEFYQAVRGQGALRNGKTIGVSNVTTLGEVTLGMDWGRSGANRSASLGAVDSVGHEVKTIRAIGSAALALAWVASGRLDAYMNPSLGAWDIAAGQLLIEEAGGQVTDMQGKNIILPKTKNCLATNGRVHPSLTGL